MTIFVPQEAAAVLEGTPVFGSVEQITAIGRYVQDVSADTMQYSTDVQNAQFTLQTERSSALESITAKLREALLPGANAAFRSAEDAKRALDAYASEVDRIHASARSAREQTEESLSEIRVSAAQIEDIASLIRVDAPYAWDHGAPGVMPQPHLGPRAGELDADEQDAVVQQLRSMHEHDWTRVASIWRNAIESIEEAKRVWVNLIGERRRAEERLSGALADTAIGQLISVSSGDAESRTFTIAVSMTGELWGVSDDVPQTSKSHPLLKKLIGTESGERVWEDPPDPAEVAAAWAALEPAERDRLIEETPWVIGNLPGLPFEVRDAANRKMVEFYQRYPQAMTPEQLALMADIREISKREEEQERSFGKGRPPIQLVALDMTGEMPMAAVGYGDLDTATSATWQVAGMNSDAHLALEGWDEASRNVYNEQNNVAPLPGSNAVVAWLGYDTPNMPTTGDFGVLDVKAARAGAPRFAAELEGQHAARSISDFDPPFVTVISHSYGTTVATIALTQLSVDHPVDALVMLGSAGLDTELVPSYDALRVKDLEPGQKAIFTTFAEGDAIAPFGAGLSRRGQPNPGATDPFSQYLRSPVYEGGLSFSSEGDPGRGLEASDGHSVTGEGPRASFMGGTASEGHGYLDRKTQVLETVAKLSMGLIDAELRESFTRTEGSCVEVITGMDGTEMPRRVKCESK
ncbi:alpha/beta hydrolase [Leucobacter sp. NPDC077196]|uniref:alpha/beta hydrolase n=1 Tax=Leucobacter sp. NPDC077196 TaxID=3154959 RepID=UPI0034364B4D